MKAYRFLIVIVFGWLLCGCDKEDDLYCTPPSYDIEDSSFIMAYAYGDPEFESVDPIYRGLINLWLGCTEDVCFSEDFYNTFGQGEPRQSEEAKRRFLETARENGDLHYTGSVGFPQIAYAQHLREIHLTCDANWDEAHPKGTLLDDIFYMTCYPYASFFKSGYTTEWKLYTKKLSLFTPEDLYIAHADNLICTLYTPDHLFGKDITFFLKVTMDDGRIIDLQCSFKGEDWEELPSGFNPTI